MAKQKNENIKKASDEWEYLTGDEEIKRIEFLKFKWQVDYNSQMENAREEGLSKGLKEGLSRGLEEGKAKGRAEGRAEGREKGIKEGMKKGSEKEKIEIAKNLLKSNISIDVIINATGLTEKEIQDLKKKLNS